MPPSNLHELPEGIPAPVSDGACDHLPGIKLPPIVLPATSGETVGLPGLPGRTVVYCCPLTGRPGEDLPQGWDEIPGARGCTPQSCAFRDHYVELRALGTRIYGLNVQDTGYQREAAEHLHLPFELLSDESLFLIEALGFPTFGVEGMRLIRRLTLLIQDGRTEKGFYPVFPPNKNAEEGVEWLQKEAA
ncbi:MAG: peroxiredoxin [Actinomycetota bacterium]|nr:peroxiredoxin [Actinomycetota bacterium]